MFEVLLYYKFTTIEDPEFFAAEHKRFCESLGLKGRIWIASEGVNGTVSGSKEATTIYRNALANDVVFSGIEFKIDEVEGHTFKKMIVRPKKELVTWRFEYEIDPLKKTGNYLSPEEFYKAMTEEDVVIFDIRNDYEYDLGHFKNAIRAEVETSKDMPQWAAETLSQYKDKKVLTYCTGGIRCEKFTGFLLDQGFTDVNQLHGGIINYGKKMDGKNFEGYCYVFDERISVPINHTEEATVITNCQYCGTPTPKYLNCANQECHELFLCCPECEITHKRSCSPECEKAEKHEFHF